MKLTIPSSKIKYVEIEIPFYIYWDFGGDNGDTCDVYLKITEKNIYEIKYKQYFDKEEYSFEVTDNNWKPEALYKYYLQDRTEKEKYQEIKVEAEQFISENFN